MDEAFLSEEEVLPERRNDWKEVINYINAINYAIAELENLPISTRLIRIAHYQFETIHPFLDGNGRIGRLLITLFLVDQRILAKPLLYLSSYFEKDESLYYDNLTFVRTRNDMTQWIKYFLVGVAETADKASETLSSVLSLKSRLENETNQMMGRKSQKQTARRIAPFPSVNPTVY